MAVDTNRVSELSVWWSSVIDSPLEIIVGTYFLYQILGVSCLFGLLAMIFVLPLNHVAAKYYAKTQDNLMKARDHRVSLMTEASSNASSFHFLVYPKKVLQGIRMIKFFAWEKNWEKRVLDARRTELKQLRYNFIYLALLDLLWMASPIFVTIISFLYYTKIQGNQLTAAVAFTSIAIFNELRFALNVLPELFVDAVQALISLKRIDKFLQEDEIDTSLENAVSHGTTLISFVNAVVTWNKIKNAGNDSNGEVNEFLMRDLNLNFPIGELSVICGPTGSGKTLLLLSLLGETNVLSGKINCPRSPTDRPDKDINALNWILPNGVAYVAQQPWLQNASIRDNILFGLPYDEERYNQVIMMCALEKDFEVFEDGDMTEIGEKGITLSGGQKQRCALARAVYSRAKHILIDDVLSAVDAHTARHLMNECLLGPLMKGRTRILVTHHVGLCLSVASYLVVTNNGEVRASGNLPELRNSGTLVSVLEESDSRIEFQDLAETTVENVIKSNTDKTSKKLYQKLLNRVIRAPLRFFDTTPVGRILNRFSKDFETIDSNLIGITV
ncbi:12436_t:CDS:2 [Acaulospora colombiana]|uniref:12436_t:CDS:1 n=1 Tax=Acaulospora colombiana TaxID=27376 RepID=A0ACA9M405_9GLOM|nr:12436_t:CDS:2 [Acaulospora colombiana]